MRPPEGLSIHRDPDLDVVGQSAAFTVRSSSPTLQGLARLAEQTDTPIYHQLRVEFAVRQLVVQLTPMVDSYQAAMRGVVEALHSTGKGLAVFAAKVRQSEAERAARMAPEAVLDHIRQDQASLDWRDQWARERDYARAAGEGL